MNSKSWRTREPIRESNQKRGTQSNWATRTNSHPQPNRQQLTCNHPPLPKPSYRPDIPLSVQHNDIPLSVQHPNSPECWVCGADPKVSASDIEHVSRTICDYRDQIGVFEEWIVKATGEKLKCYECQRLFDGTIRWSDVSA
jgi:hypothetical protein